MDNTWLIIEQWNAASDDWHTTASHVDLRVGGTFSSRMEAKDGRFGFDFAGTYTKIVPHALIEYAFGERTERDICPRNRTSCGTTTRGLASHLGSICKACWVKDVKFLSTTAPTSPPPRESL